MIDESPQCVTLDTLAEITLDLAWRVGFRNANLTLSDRAEARIKDCRAGFERLLASDGGSFIYGTTAAPGARAKDRLTPEDQEKLAKSQNLWAPNAFGGGKVVLPERVVRLIILARVAGYTKSR